MMTSTPNTLSQKERRVFPFLRLMRQNGWKLVRITGSHHIHVKPGKCCIPVVVHNRCVRRDVARAVLKQAGLNVGDYLPHVSADEELVIEKADTQAISAVDASCSGGGRAEPNELRPARHAAALAPVVLATEEDETVLQAREEGRQARRAHLEEQATRLRSLCDAAAAALAEALDTTALVCALENLENLRDILLRSFDDIGKSFGFAPGTRRVAGGAEQDGDAAPPASSFTVDDAETLCRAAATCMSVDERTSLLCDVMFIHSLSSLEYAVVECEFGSEVQDLLIRACFTQLDTCVKKIVATASREGNIASAAASSSSKTCDTATKLQEWKQSLTDFLCARYLESLHKCTKVVNYECNRREPPKGYTTGAELEQMKKPNKVVSEEEYKKSRVGMVKGLHLLLDLFGVRGNSRLRLLGPGINCERDEDASDEMEMTATTAAATASQAEILEVARPAKASKNKKKRQAQREAEAAAAKEQLQVADVATLISQRVEAAVPAQKELWTEAEREEPPDLSFVQQLVCPETVLYYEFMGLPFAQRFSIAANQACEYLSVRFGPCFLDSAEITRFFTRLATFQLAYPIFEWMYLLDQVTRFPTPGEHDRMLQCTSCLSRRAKPDRADRETLQLRLQTRVEQASGQRHKEQAPFAWKDVWNPHLKKRVGDLAFTLVANLRTAVGVEDPREPNVHDLFAGAKRAWIVGNTAVATLRHVNGRRGSGVRFSRGALRSKASLAPNAREADDLISAALNRELPLIVGADLHAELEALGVPTSLADLTGDHLETLAAWKKAGREYEHSDAAESAAEQDDEDSSDVECGVEENSGDAPENTGKGSHLLAENVLERDERAALPARYDCTSDEYDENATAEAVRRGRAILNTYRYSPVNQEQIWIENCVLHTELAELNKVPTRDLGLPIGIAIDKDSAVAEWVELISSLQHERTENACSVAKSTACSVGGDKTTTKAQVDPRAERLRGQLLQSPTNLIKHHLRCTANSTTGDHDVESKTAIAQLPQPVADVRVRLDIWRNDEASSTYQSAAAASNVCSSLKLISGRLGARHGLRLLRQHTDSILRFCDEMLRRLSAYPYPVAWRGRGCGFGAQLRRVNLLLFMVLRSLSDLHDEELFAGDLYLKVFEVVKMTLRSAKLFLERVDPEADRTRDDGCGMHSGVVRLAAVVCARYDVGRSGRTIFVFFSGIFCMLLVAFEEAGPRQLLLGEDSKMIAGERKQLRGLQGKPQYNGALVRLLGPMPADANRWRVLLEDVAPGQELSVKIESLGAVAPDRFLFVMWWEVRKLLTGLTEEVTDFMNLDEQDKHWHSHLLWRRRTHSPKEFRDFLTDGKTIKDQYFNPMRNYLFRILWRILVDTTPISMKKLKQKHKNIVKAIQDAADARPRGGASTSTMHNNSNDEKAANKPGEKQKRSITRKTPFAIPDSTTTSRNVSPQFFSDYCEETSTLREDVLQLHRLATVLQQDLHESALASFKDPPSARLWEVTRKALADAQATAGLVPFEEQARLPTSTLQAMQEELDRRGAEARNPHQQKSRLAQLLAGGAEDDGAEVGYEGPIECVRSEADKALVRRAASDCLRDLMSSGAGHGRNAATSWALETGMRYCQLRDTFGKIVAKVKPIFGGHDYVALADARAAVSLTKQNAPIPVMNAMCAQRLELEALCAGLGIESFPVPMD
ncbi:unnamed protein product [Amoebophrya sp. A120]|nr:unnamed protein product [Amoebophrya sp. A120]|eukprot:GSA120T00010401001.1